MTLGFLAVSTEGAFLDLRQAVGEHIYHFSHVFSYGLNRLNRVDGDGAGLLHTQLTLKTLLQLLLSEVEFGIGVMLPLKDKNKTQKINCLTG